MLIHVVTFLIGCMVGGVAVICWALVAAGKNRKLDERAEDKGHQRGRMEKGADVKWKE